MSVTDAALACVQALYDAAADDSATGGPDLTRQIFPVIVTVTEGGGSKPLSVDRIVGDASGLGNWLQQGGWLKQDSLL